MMDYPTATTAALAIPEKNPSKQFFNLSPGRKGVFETCEAMAACVRGEVAPDFAGYDSPQIAGVIAEIEASYFGQPFIESVFAYTQNSIQYAEHPFDMQIVQDAPTTMRVGVADCVSMSVLIATCLAAHGWPVWFVLQDPLGIEYSHVYCETVIDGKIVALDAVSRESLGWRQQLPDAGFETTWLIF